jgi:hypothetical protein
MGQSMNTAKIILDYFDDGESEENIKLLAEIINKHISEAKEKERASVDYWIDRRKADAIRDSFRMNASMEDAVESLLKYLAENWGE